MMMTIEASAPATPPFDFSKSTGFLGTFEPAASEQVAEPARLIKALRVGGHTVVVDLTSHGTVDAPALRCRLRSAEDLPAAVAERTVARIRFVLGMDEDLAEFYRLGRADPAFAPVVEALYGYHQVKFPSAFENACWAVLCQRCPLPVARAMKDRLTASYGGRATVGEHEHRAFPEPADLGDVSADELAACLGHPLKARRLAGVVAAFLEVEEESLRQWPSEELAAWLQSIEGIGPWSSSFVMVRGLGRTASVAGIEASLIPVVSHRYGRKVTAAGVRRLAAPYGPWQGYWAHYLRVAG